jgi:hypothetical protein
MTVLHLASWAHNLISIMSIILIKLLKSMQAQGQVTGAGNTGSKGGGIL